MKKMVRIVIPQRIILTSNLNTKTTKEPLGSFYRSSRKGCFFITL